MRLVVKKCLPVMPGNKHNGVYIRQAARSDQAAIQAVTLAAYQEYAVFMTPQSWRTYRRNILDTLNESQPAMQLVAEREGKIVGSVLLNPTQTEGEGSGEASDGLESSEIRLLAVSPTARIQGTGKALMNACVERARQAGVKALTLHTSDVMQIAMRMYEKMGFVRAPELDFRPAENMLIKGYRLELEPQDRICGVAFSQQGDKS
jgi:predicted N-acetyltransferase YhbS